MSKQVALDQPIIRQLRGHNDQETHRHDTPGKIRRILVLFTSMGILKDVLEACWKPQYHLRQGEENGGCREEQ